jgi:beta-glucosidase-like glycosyl hydrolase
MGAIAQRLPADQAARKALAAGADLLLLCQNWQAVRDAVRLLEGDASLLESARKSATLLARLRRGLAPNRTSQKQVREYFGGQSLG